MRVVDRKTIENYFEKEWASLVSPDTTNTLIEITCKAYKLNKPEIPGFVKKTEPPKPQDLGKI